MEVDGAVEALRRGEAVILPTDTVYGLCATPSDPEAATRLSRLKGRLASKPIALLAVDVEGLLDAVPELGGIAVLAARALFPGPYTLVVPNPARRYPWLTGENPDAIGVRVPALAGPCRAVLERVRCLAATSANRAGEPDPRRLTEVPREIRRGCGAVVDGGELPGTPSTVVDLTGEQPRVVREGAVRAEEALARIRAAFRGK